MVTKATILASLLRYVAGTLPVEQFEHELPDAWELDEANDPELRSLVLGVMGQLGEFTRGDIDEAALRARLSPLAEWTRIVEVVYPDPVNYRGRAWVSSTATGSFVAADRQLAEAHG